MKEIDKYFLKYKNLCRKIHRKESEIAYFEQTYLGAVNYDEEVSNSSKQPQGLDMIIIQLEKLEEELTRLYDKKTKCENNHIKDFEKLSNDDYEFILTNYYFYHCTIKDLSVKLDKSISHIKKLKRDAIKKLLDIVQKNNT